VKLEHEVTINKPIQVVWDYTNDRDNLHLWLNDFVRYEDPIGDENAPKIGDTVTMVYRQGKSEFSMLEEITEWDPPNHLKTLMTSKAMDMTIVSKFEEIGENQTRLYAGADLFRLSLMMKAIFFVTPTKKMQGDHERQINKLKELIEAL